MRFPRRSLNESIGSPSVVYPLGDGFKQWCRFRLAYRAHGLGSAVFRMLLLVEKIGQDTADNDDPRFGVVL